MDLERALLIAGRLAPLLVPVLLGAIAGATRLFKDPEAALGGLNRFALYFAFPALVVVSLARTPGDVAVSWRFFAVNVGLLVVGVTVMGAAARRLRPDEATGAHQLIVLFGNVAYLGLPFAERVLPPDAFAVAVLGVAVHVTCSLVGGPALLLRGAAGGRREILGRVARQPLVWAPLAGLALREVPPGPTAVALDLLGPVGQAAAPVALFVLGLYVFLHRGALKPAGVLDWMAWAPKVVLLPLLAWGLARAAGLSEVEIEATVTLAAMPTAITTFAFALDFGVGRDVAVRAIVWSSTLSLLTLTLLAGWLI